MKLAKIFILIIVAVLPLLVHGRGRKNRWGCASNSDCAVACRRTCSSFVRPLCYSSLCYCQALGQAMGQAMGYPRPDYRRVMSPPDPDELFDYDIKQI